MLESIAEGVLAVTRDGLILFSTERFASLLGMPLDRVIGSSIYELIAAEDAALLRPLLTGNIGRGLRSG